MKTLYLFYTIFFLALTACATSQKEEPTTVLAHQTVEIKNDYLGWVGQLLVTGDRLYGNEHQMDTCFFYVDLTKNELHRIPVEIETATGVQTLYLEYHDNDNAFEAAQSFIDKHGVLLTSLLDCSSTKTIWMK